MSKCIVQVVEIDKSEKHNNADTLDIHQILGWQVITKRGEFKIKDIAVYFPTGTVLPDTLIELLGIQNYLSGPEHNRVSKIKLRGERSFGMLVPIHALNIVSEEKYEVGTDLSEMLGCYKYEPPINQKSGAMGLTNKKHEFWQPYTDIENVRNYPNIFEENEEIIVTEKIHGTNVYVGRIFHENGEQEDFASSRKVQRTKPDNVSELKNNRYWLPWTLPQFDEMINNIYHDLLEKQIEGFTKQQTNVVDVFGETYGKGVQSLAYGRTNIGFVVFDIRINGEYISFKETISYCEKHDISHVPVLCYEKYDFARLKWLSDGKTVLGNYKHIREGIVFRPIVERTNPKIGRVILKMIGDKYMMSKHQDLDTTDN